MAYPGALVCLKCGALPDEPCKSYLTGKPIADFHNLRVLLSCLPPGHERAVARLGQLLTKSDPPKKEETPE